MLRRASTRAGIVALGLAVALSTVGCSALLPTSDPGPQAASPQQPQQPQQQTVDAACGIVTAEWGLALDAWPAIEDPQDTGARQDFAKAETEHKAMIADLQKVADKIEAPDVRSVLDTTIDAHQRYADEIWGLLEDVPAGYPVVLDDPKNKLVIVGEKVSDYKRELAAADMQRYDLCGAVKSNQTGVQACEIVNQAWTDGAQAFNAAARSVSRGDITGGIESGEAALQQIKAAMIQVNVPEVLDELVVMYDAYETYYTGFSTVPTDDEMSRMSEDELIELTDRSDKMFQDWDGVLTRGVANLTTYCNGLD
ncbi:hypothetical protein Q9R19_00770 [Microbacterium sp. ARD32]|uniref:hypothetical protein n=1 Tax=Microbacterium sp. ARD32 TaxID=2962577 RepID=UPI0028828E03|nr:hypothetical protein [Microbacterium sp. ARD32]MDT0156153.1 hypothetical protein [Microbacterium sp. ARD32]